MDDELDLPELDEESVERAVYALSRFVFPGYLVPRQEMARAVLAAVRGGEDWKAYLPPKRRAVGEPG